MGLIQDAQRHGGLYTDHQKRHGKKFRFEKEEPDELKEKPLGKGKQFKEGEINAHHY